MKIWLNTTLDAVYDKDCECIDDCVDPSLQRQAGPLSIVEADVKQVWRGELQQASALYRQSCSAEHWLVCNPVEAGHIVVVDADALALLDLFETPQALLQAVRVFSAWAIEDIEKIVVFFYKLGFLQCIDEPATIYTEKPSDELVAWLHVTNACNLNCHYCYISKTADTISLDIGRKAVDALFRSALKRDIRRIKVKYAGGEASLHMRGVVALHDYAMALARQHGISLKGVLLSNGVVLSQRNIDLLKERSIAVTISLDGLGSYHDQQRPLRNGRGSSSYVLRTIERLLANGMIPLLTITVSRRNLDGLPELMSYILARDIPFTINYYRENEHSAHIADLRFAEEQIIETMRAVFLLIEKNIPERSLLNCLLDKTNMVAPHQHTCGVGHNYLVIDQAGGVAKCQMQIANTVTTIDAADPLQIVMEDHTSVPRLSVEEKEGCRDCFWRYWCTGGCPVLTYQITGRYDVKSPNCGIYQALFPEVLRLEALRLLRYEQPMVARCPGVQTC